jgi:hypothetical protein
MTPEQKSALDFMHAMQENFGESRLRVTVGETVVEKDWIPEQKYGTWVTPGPIANPRKSKWLK